MSKLKTRLTAAGITALAICGVATVAAAPAHAAGRTVYKVSNNNGAYGEFRSYGEVTCATDTRADDHGAKTVVQKKQQGVWVLLTGIYENRGKGRTTCWPTYSGLAEGTSIRVKACLQDGYDNTPYACSPWKYGTA